ncbi:MAG TPA: hypothetical protein VFJ61_06020 [Solirubrobacterales bacterium]|nr:hypothetical protein [Solirubrobacterales bacterium]
MVVEGFQLYLPRDELHGQPVVERDGDWYVLLGEGDPVPIPGARLMKVQEMVGHRTRTTERYGLWIEIDRETAHSDPDLLRWCRRHCNSELPSGTFRFSPRIWDRRSQDFLPVPYFPELDHPDSLIRELAGIELFRRIAEQQLRWNRQQRDELIRITSEEGHSRRNLARLLGISPGRVQQLVDSDAEPGSSSTGLL